MGVSGISAVPGGAPGDPSAEPPAVPVTHGPAVAVADAPSPAVTGGPPPLRGDDGPMSPDPRSQDQRVDDAVRGGDEAPAHGPAATATVTADAPDEPATSADVEDGGSAEAPMAAATLDGQAPDEHLEHPPVAVQDDAAAPAAGDTDQPDADLPAPDPASGEGIADTPADAAPVPAPLAGEPAPPAEGPAPLAEGPAPVDGTPPAALPAEPEGSATAEPAVGAGPAAAPGASADLDADDVVRAAFSSGPHAVEPHAAELQAVEPHAAEPAGPSVPPAGPEPEVQAATPAPPEVREPVWPVVAPTGYDPETPARVVEPARPVALPVRHEPAGEAPAPQQPQVEPVRPVVPPVRYETAAPPVPAAEPAARVSPQAAPPRPTRADTRAAARAAAKSRTAAGKAPRRRAAPTGRAAAHRRRRLWPVLLAAVLAVAVGALAFLAVDLVAGRGEEPVARPVPGAVLPVLAEPAPALAELSAEAPAPDPTVLSGVLTPLLAAPALGTGLSAQVVDVATGEVLFARSAEDPSTPASTAKLLTGLAVLTSLDPESTLPTRVVAGAVPGEVVLVGGGDPTLSTTTPSTVYPGAATVGALADQVRQQLGGTPVTRVVVDNSLFTGPLTAPGWGPDDAPSTYAAPVTATAVDGARVDPDGNQRSGAPGTDAGAALAVALDAPTAEVVLGPAPAGARTLGAVESAPVRRLVEQALTDSDNLLTESLARHVALARDLPASFAGSAEAVTEAVADAGLDTTGLTLVDASGLSAQDRAPARLLVDAVEVASDGSVPGAAGLLTGLPVAGYTGTLAERTVDGAEPGAVRAKTGTLLAVHDLAGTVLTADGRLLAFAVLADGAAGGPVVTETALDGIAAALAACGCR